MSMNPSDDAPEVLHQRWYDTDPALKRALDTLRAAPDKYQAQVALNIIKIVIEHQIENGTGSDSDDIQSVLERSQDSLDAKRRRRWYDVNETLRSAIHLIRDCPDDLQQSVIPTITRMIEETLSSHDDA